MMIYANMDFYKNKYQGAVINTANLYVYFRKATNYIRHYTCDNIDEGDIPEQVVVKWLNCFIMQNKIVATM